MSLDTTSDTLTRRAVAALVYGRVGDAMGTPTENLEPEAIAARFGWVDSFTGDGTDDSIMAELIATALINTEGYANADDWARVCLDRREKVFGDKVGKFFVSVIHAFSKLRYGYLPRLVALGNMPSSSSAMAIAPVGIVNAGHPRAAAAQAAEIASLLHIHDVSFCQDGAAAIAAAVAAGLSAGATIDSVVAAAPAYIKPWSGGEMRGRIERALGMARTLDYEAFRAAYHRDCRCAIACDSRETVPAALALSLLAKGDPETAVAYGANFGRDTDTIACMAGYVCGALSGEPAAPRIAVPEALRRPARELAVALVTVGRSKAAAEIAAWQNSLNAA